MFVYVLRNTSTKTLMFVYVMENHVYKTDIIYICEFDHVYKHFAYVFYNVFTKTVCILC